MRHKILQTIDIKQIKKLAQTVENHSYANSFSATNYNPLHFIELDVLGFFYVELNVALFVDLFPHLVFYCVTATLTTCLVKFILSEEGF